MPNAKLLTLFLVVGMALCFDKAHAATYFSQTSSGNSHLLSSGNAEFRFTSSSFSGSQNISSVVLNVTSTTSTWGRIFRASGTGITDCVLNNGLTEYTFPDNARTLSDMFHSGDTKFNYFHAYTNDTCTDNNSSVVTIFGLDGSGSFERSGLFGDTLSFFPYMLLGENQVVGDLTIANPSPGSFIQIPSTSFNGTCPINGTNQLALINVASNNNSASESDFTIDCTSHAWSTTHDISLGGQQFAIVDHSWLADQPGIIAEGAPCGSTFCETAFVNFTGTAPNYEYNLAILYPQCTNGVCDNLATTSNFPFRFSYSVPTDKQESDHFYLEKDCDSGFLSCTEVDFGTINNADPDGNGFIDTGTGDAVIISDSTKRYYVVKIKSGSIVDTSLVFTTKENTTTGQNPVLPKARCTGFFGPLCELFIPRGRVVNLLTDNIPSLLKTKVPFGYFYAVSDKLTNVNSGETSLSVIVPIHIANTNISWHLIDSSDSSYTHITDVLKPIITWALWLGLIFYVYVSIRDMNL